MLGVLETRFGLNYQPVNHLSDVLGQRVRSSIDPSTASYQQPHADLGWTPRPNVNTGLYQTNSDGIRSLNETTKSIPNKMFRWATFGDSFTHGDEVGNNETWQSLVENMTPNWEFLNFGVGGYSIDQAYLRYKAATERFVFSGVIIGVQSRDIFEVVNTFRPFSIPRTSSPFGKPRFSLKGDKLELLPNPLSDLQAYSALLQSPEIRLEQIGRNDLYYVRRYKTGYFDSLNSVRLVKILSEEYDRRVRERNILKNGLYNTENETFHLTGTILKRFSEEASENGALPVVLFLPNKKDIVRSRSGAEVSYSPLRDFLSRAGLVVIDPQVAFQTEDDIDDLIGGHYTALGNRRLAEYLSVTLFELVR